MVGQSPARSSTTAEWSNALRVADRTRFVPLSTHSNERLSAATSLMSTHGSLKKEVSMTRWILTACVGLALAGCSSSTTTVVQGTAAPSTFSSTRYLSG